MPPHILVVAGLGNVQGTGAAVARLFAKGVDQGGLGYRVALVSRPRKEVGELKEEILAGGGEAEVFGVDEYSHQHIGIAFSQIREAWPGSRIKTAVWNAGAWSNIPFLDITEKDINLSMQVNVIAATAFSQHAVRAFLEDAEGSTAKGGTLIMTGATSAWRGLGQFGAFAAGKHGLRALSQSIAREYGPKGVHVSFVVIDGVIRTKRTLALFGSQLGNGREAGWLEDPASLQALRPESIAKCYKYLHEQEADCWTLEMDLRPSREKF